MTHYQTTSDKVLALVPPPSQTANEIDGILLPDGFKPARPKGSTSIIELTAHSVGPDCKTVKPGDRFLYNINHGDPILYQDIGFYVLPEGQIMAVVRERPSEALKTALLKPPTMDEIRGSLGMINPDKMPEEPPPANA